MTKEISILIVDDNPTNLALMDMLVRRLPNCTTRLYSSPLALLDCLSTIEFDIAIFEYRMPKITGVELARSVRAHARLATKPIVIVTAEQDAAVRELSLEGGAVEFLQKPVEPVEFRTRLSALAQLPDRRRVVRRSSEWSWSASPGEAAVPRLSEDELIGAFARAAGYKDRETPLHATRVACYCGILAHHLGLPENACAELRLAAPLHDVGKVGLGDEVLTNRGILTDEQRRHMGEHTRIGHAILSGGRSSVMRLAAEIALTHHERWDGSGYPQGLKAEQIPLAGRIVAVADVFDALTSVRSYKSAWSLPIAYDYLAEKSGELFDPKCVAAFHSGRPEVAAIMEMMPDHFAYSEVDAA